MAKPSNSYSMAHHSTIINYPIDYTLFPNAKNVIFHEYIITPKEYLFIPHHWFHWIFSEPYTVSSHYIFYNHNIKSHNDDQEEYSDLFYNDIVDNQPFTGKSMKDLPFNINDLLTSTFKFRALCSNEYDVSPLKKQDSQHKYLKIDTISNLLKESKEKNIYAYVGKNSIDKTLDIYNDMNNIIHSSYTYHYEPTLWFTIDKPVQSGLHFDSYSSLIYILSGQKKVLLAEPTHINNLYMHEDTRI